MIIFGSQSGEDVDGDDAGHASVDGAIVLAVAAGGAAVAEELYWAN